MQSEVQAIMAPMGIRFEWHALDSSQESPVAVELAVITFKGECDSRGFYPRDTNPGALGWTHISDGVILPFAVVDCGAVRGFIQRELLSLRADVRCQAFGRALGRVLAHELYHIFANTKRHGAEGVGRSVYSPQDLLAPDFQFEARESTSLKTSKAHVALEIAGAASEEFER